MSVRNPDLTTSREITSDTGRHMGDPDYILKTLWYDDHKLISLAAASLTAGAVPREADIELELAVPTMGEPPCCGAPSASMLRLRSPSPHASSCSAPSPALATRCWGLWKHVFWAPSKALSSIASSHTEHGKSKAIHSQCGKSNSAMEYWRWQNFPRSHVPHRESTNISSTASAMSHMLLIWRPSGIWAPCRPLIKAGLAQINMGSLPTSSLTFSCNSASKQGDAGSWSRSISLSPEAKTSLKGSNVSQAWSSPPLLPAQE